MVFGGGRVRRGTGSSCASENDMPPSWKDMAISNPPRRTDARSPRSTLSQRLEESPRPQPVALEVPVTVHGAREAEGSSKREPFSETTRTVLIFARGAVIRLSSAVAPGQLLFLTNENTKKETVCQVVKSKNYKNVSGYVEVEFTEASVGFWGMRFPTDRLAPDTSAPAATPASGASAPATFEAKSEPVPTSLAVPKISAPTASGDASAAIFPLASAGKPTDPAPLLPKITLPPPAAAPPVVTAQSVHEPPAFTSQGSQSGQVRAEILTSSEPKTTSPPRIESAAVSPLPEAVPNAENLWPPLPAAAPPEKPKDQRSAASMLEEEGVPVPSWFDPGARKNAQSGTQAPATPPAPAPFWLEPVNAVAKERPTAFVEHVEEAVEALAPSPTEMTVPTFDAPLFSSDLLIDQAQGDEGRWERSGHGRLIGAIAAVLVLSAAGGAWYLYGPSLSAKNNSAPGFASNLTSATTSSPSHSAALPAASAQDPPVSNAAPAATGPTNFTGSPNFVARARAKNSRSADAAPLRESARKELRSMQNSLADKQPDEQAEKPAEEAAPKQPVLPQIRLAAPVVTRDAASTQGSEADLNLAATVPAPPVTGDPSAALGDANHPEAPKPEPPVGGNVQPARLLSSVPPVYPQAARNMRVSGDVIVDALIDASGRVTAMKAVSGSPLLHQAAMDALKQWKYAPAALNGEPVAVHMKVTIRFRLQ